jgi:signal transduction histidine kinase
MSATTSARAPGAESRIDPILLLPGAAAGGLLVTWWTLSRGVSTSRAAVDLAVVWTFASASVVALLRPSLRVSGALMGGVAATWYLYELQLSRVALLWTIGWVFASLYEALIVQLVLSYPDGRIWSRSALATVVATYVVTAGGAILTAFYQPSGENLLLIDPDQARADGIGRVTSLIGVGIVVVVVLLVAVRLLRLRGVARRLALPLLVGALLTMPTTFVRLAASAAGDFALYDRLALVDRFMTILIPVGFVVGLMWSRLRRSGASSLVVELRDGGSETLRDRLARALGDPTLEVAYWDENSRSYVDDAGRPMELDAAGSRAVTHVVSSTSPVAALVHDLALLEEPELVESVRATAALVLENERLAAEIRAQLAEVEASRVRIVAATDEERRRLERDLHDGAQQQLVGLSLKLALAQVGADPAAAEALASAQDDLERALAELREFARGIHPSILREDGLDAGLQTLARRASVPVAISGAVGRRLPDAVELAAYFFVSEALTNVAKHARASQVIVSIDQEAGVLAVRVSDDGVGGARADAGSGLAGLSDRLDALGGTLDVMSDPAHGTTLTARIPCES